MPHWSMIDLVRAVVFHCIFEYWKVMIGFIATKSSFLPLATFQNQKSRVTTEIELRKAHHVNQAFFGKIKDKILCRHSSRDSMSP